MFVLVTIIGVLIIQNSIYAIFVYLLGHHSYMLQRDANQLLPFNVKTNFLIVNISNLFGSLAAMFWNYNAYKKFVFLNNGEEVINEINLPA